MFHNQQNVIDLAMRYADRLRAAGIHLNGVYLFGSALHDVRKAHDVDICVVTDDLSSNKFDSLSQLLSYAAADEWMIEPHPFTTDELGTSDVLAHVIQTGLKIV